MIPGGSNHIINDVQNVRFGMNAAKGSQLYKVTHAEDVSMCTMTGPEVKMLLEGRYIHTEAKGSTTEAFSKDAHVPVFISSNVPTAKVAKRHIKEMGHRATWSVEDWIKCFDLKGDGTDEDGEGRIGTCVRTEVPVPPLFRHKRADTTCRKCSARYVRWLCQQGMRKTARRIDVAEIHINSDCDTDDESLQYNTRSVIRVVLQRGKRKQVDSGNPGEDRKRKKILAWVDDGVEMSSDSD
jgi:hypothetical protein